MFNAVNDAAASQHRSLSASRKCFVICSIMKICSVFSPDDHETISDMITTYVNGLTADVKAIFSEKHSSVLLYDLSDMKVTNCLL
jgi:hypothetical protein